MGYFEKPEKYFGAGLWSVHRNLLWVSCDISICCPFTWYKHSLATNTARKWLDLVVSDLYTYEDIIIMASPGTIRPGGILDLEVLDLGVCMHLMESLKHVFMSINV